MTGRSKPRKAIWRRRKAALWYDKLCWLLRIILVYVHTKSGEENKAFECPSGGGAALGCTAACTSGCMAVRPFGELLVFQRNYV